MAKLSFTRILCERRGCNNEEQNRTDVCKNEALAAVFCCSRSRNG